MRKGITQWEKRPVGRGTYQSISLASIYSRWNFHKKSVQIPSCEMAKTTQRTLFLSFEINNCFQITAKCGWCNLNVEKRTFSTSKLDISSLLFVYFALLDPDPDLQTDLDPAGNAYPCASGSQSTTLFCTLWIVGIGKRRVGGGGSERERGVREGGGRGTRACDWGGIIVLSLRSDPADWLPDIPVFAVLHQPSWATLHHPDPVHRNNQ